MSGGFKIVFVLFTGHSAIIGGQRVEVGGGGVGFGGEPCTRSGSLRDANKNFAYDIFWFNFLYYQEKFFFVGAPEDTKNSFTERRGESSKWINVLTFKDSLHVTK